MVTDRLQLITHALLSEPAVTVEVPALSIAKAAAVTGALVAGGHAGGLVEVDPLLATGRIPRRLLFFERVTAERRARGEHPTADDELSRAFFDVLTLQLAEQALSQERRADERSEEAARDRLERSLDRAERRFFEASVPLLFDENELPPFILRLAPRGLSEEHLVPEAQRGLRTLVTPSPDERVRRLTGCESVEALSRQITQTEEAAGLQTCQVILDTGCNQRCVHCFLGTKRPVLELDRLERLLAEELPAAGLVPRLYYSEPFTRAWRRRGELERLVALLARYQPHLVLTNGQDVDDEVLELLERHGPFRVYVGLLGASAATHERITGSPGSFARTVAAIEQLSARRARGITLCLNVMVYRDNLVELRQMIERASSWGASAVFLSTLYPAAATPPSLAELCLGREQRLALLEELGVLRREFRGSPHLEIGGAIGLNFHSRGIFHYLAEGLPYCPAGRTSIALHPVTGKIYPCMKLTAPQFEIGHWDRELGRPVIDAERNVLARLTHDVGALQGECSPERCAWAPICRGGCRAVAAFHSPSGGDLFAGQPYCLTRLLDE